MFDPSPRGMTLAEAKEDAKDMKGISRCSRYLGWHAYKAGPCFDSYEEVLAYRNSLDAEGVTWRQQR